jgi:hypothetical protein
MPLAQVIPIRAMPIQSDLEAIITESVNSHAGVRDTFLTLDVLTKFVPHPEIAAANDSAYAASQVAKAIHRMIHEGKLVGIDCETPETSFTYILPAGSRAIIAMPVYVKDSRTRH